VWWRCISPHGNEDAAVAAQVGDGGERATDPRPALDDEEGHVDAVGVVGDLLLLHDVRADSSDVAKRFVGFAAGLCQRDELLFREDLHAEALQEHADGDDGDEREYDESELPVVGEDGDEADDDLAETLGVTACGLIAKPFFSGCLQENMSILPCMSGGL
jgi:hypothetical protein